MEKTSSFLCAIRTTRAHGLDGNALWDVTRATVVADERRRLQSVVKKVQRCLPIPFKTVDELRQEWDENLFRSSRYADMTLPGSV